MNSEPAAAILSIFDQLIERIKQRTPVRTNDKPLGTMVYSQLVLGMPIAKDDYFNPWTPLGSNTPKTAFPAPPAAAPGSPPSPPPVDQETMRALRAAWKTSMLCRTMLQVTKDGNYKEYPTHRHLDSAYDNIVHGMQAAPVPPLSADVQARIDAARKVLYVLDQDGNVTGKTPLYKNYMNNSQALANAKANLATAFILAQRDPAKLEAFPITSQPLNLAVDQARDALVSEGGEKVEQALDVLGSIGEPTQAHMIKKARDLFDDWNIGLSGVVPGNMPYSLIMPGNWCDGEDHEGFSKLTVDETEIQHFSQASSVSAAVSSFQQHAESRSGGGAVMLGFCAFGGGAGSASMSSSFQDSTNATYSNIFSNRITGLHIELEYGMCTIERPWLTSDLFFLNGWTCSGVNKNCISDGTIDGQADSIDKLMPMIPEQFLVVRNVSISASDWGDDGELLSQFYGSSQGSSSSDASSQSGAAGVCLGFLNFGGRAGHSESDASGQSSSFAAANSSSHFGATFNGTTLTIPGAQIVAFLSDIVPACPKTDG